MELIKADAGGEFCGDSPGIEVSRLRYISSATFVSLFCGSSKINLSHFLTLTKLLILPLKFCNVPLLVVHGENGTKASNLC